MEQTQAEWITAIATVGLALATFLVAIVAVFQEKIRDRLGLSPRPSLGISLNFRPPDCHKTFLISQVQRVSVAGGRPHVVPHTVRAEVYYFRLLIENHGNAPAENVEVFLKDLKVRASDGTWQRSERFLPMNLKWSHWGVTFIEKLSRGLPKHCDLGHIIDPSQRPKLRLEDDPTLKVGPNQTILSLDLTVIPYTMSHLWPPGTYRMLVIAGASNAEPMERVIEFTVTGQWFTDEKDVLEKGVSATIL